MSKTRTLLGGALLGISALAVADDGAALFAQHCSGCHGPQAVGIEGIAPPLHNPELWQSLDAQAPRYIAGVMSGGLSGTLNVAGLDYMGLVMPPQSQIDSAQLASIAGYVLGELNGVASAPDAALIDQLKAAPLSHKELRAIRKGS